MMCLLAVNACIGGVEDLPLCAFAVQNQGNALQGDSLYEEQK